MKDKNVAAILAFFLGTFGIHRFYLGQVGLGILYCVFFWTGITAIVGFLDAILLFSMDIDRFDFKYNRRYFKKERRYGSDRKRETDFDRNRRTREQEIEKWERRQKRKERYWEQEDRERERNRPQQSPEPRRQPQPRPTPRPKTNPHKIEGIRKYKDYDYKGAIEEFLQALDLDERDVATHFNLACAYSLNEETSKAFRHLDKAVEYGFDDFKKIKNHDALAYIRIQNKFEEFERNGYRLTAQLEAPKEDLLSSPTDLLESLKKLGELRERGLLTEEEFSTQKKKLLR